MGELDVAVLVLEDHGPSPLQDAGAPAGESRRVSPRDQLLPGGLHTNQTDTRIVDERIEDPEGVAATTDTGHDGVRQAPDEREQLLTRLAPDDGLELAHHERIGMRSENRAKEVVGVLDIGDPVAHRLVDGVLERPAASI